MLYRFPSKVTLASGATMMIPFVDHEIGASRIYMYQPETNAVRPLAAIKLRNDGDSALPAGLVTAFETGAGGEVNFAGDAQLPLLPKGATRFVTFALDSKTAIRRSDRGIKQVKLGKAVRGELSITVKSLWKVDYEITPPAEEDREVIIEEPRQDGWKPVGDSAGAEETPARLRYTVLAPRGKTTKATLSREHLDYESVTLSSLAPDRIVAVVSGLENQTPALKEAIAKLGVLAGDIGKANAHKRELDAEQQEDRRGPGSHPQEPRKHRFKLRPRPPLPRYAEEPGRPARRHRHGAEGHRAGHRRQDEGSRGRRAGARALTPPHPFPSPKRRA